ncbi:MAG: hypothetical protein EXS35_08075 [Pedosphaera sp.]|nr:hypothetical protein [Pedosphaera sp.]
MKTPKQKPSGTRAARSSSRRTDPTATAQPPTTPAPSPAPAAPTPAPTAPAKRKLAGFVSELDADGALQFSPVHFRADYGIHRDAVCVVFESAHYRAVTLYLDHVHTRATIATLRQSLNEFSRFHRGRHSAAAAELPPRAQVYCYDDSANLGDDEEIRCEFRPQFDLVWLTAHLSDGGKTYTTGIYFTRAEALALLHDLERALSDLERYGAIGEI